MSRGIHTDRGYELTLAEPVTIKRRVSGSEEITEEIVGAVVMRKAKARDLRAVDGHKGGVAMSIALMAKLTGLPIAAVDELSADDFVDLAEVVAGFLPASAAASISSET